MTRFLHVAVLTIRDITTTCGRFGDRVRVVQLAEASDLKSECYGFESHRGYQLRGRVSQRADEAVSKTVGVNPL